MPISLFSAIFRIVGALSFRRAQGLGAALGLLWFHVVRVRRRTVLENLQIAFSAPQKELVAIARESYRNIGISALELAKTRSMARADLAGLVRTRGLELFDAALARGRGVVVATAHFGNFDLLATSQAARGVPLAIVSRSMGAASVNAVWMETRRASGLEIFTPGELPRRALPWLRAGKALGVVIDQRTPQKRGGILAPFFGRPVWTSTLAARLACRTGAALLPVRIERLEDGTHLMTVEPEIELGTDRDAAARATVALNRVLEGWIRSRPDHWMWLHRRFRDAE